MKPAHERANRRVGLVLKDKWHLDGLLGVGGNAAVYAATHRNGKRAAIKILHPELSTIEEVVARFLREGYAANRLEHPGAVSILDDDRADDGSVFLVMELLDGYSLDRVTRGGPPMPLDQLVRIGDTLLDVLAAAHAKGVIHRDIKPANLFLTTDNRLKVLDFGIARLVQGLATSDASATQAGESIGTPAFMPPEQARGRWTEVDARTDLWAAGATLFALAAGQRPRRAATVNEELLAAMTQPLPSVLTAVALPGDLAAVIDRACAFEMAARWPSAKAMQQALRSAAGNLRPTPHEPGIDTAPILHGVDALDPRVTTSRPTVDPSLPHAVTTNPKRSIVTAIAVFVGVVTLGIGGALFFLRTRAPEPVAAAATHAPPIKADTPARPLPAPRDTTPILSVESLPSAPVVATEVKPAPTATHTTPTTQGTTKPRPARSADPLDSRF